MQIVDLSEETLPLYLVCLEDWSAEMAEAGPHKARWREKMGQRGLRVKLARTDAGVVGGMIQYLPIAQTCTEGEDLYLILCIWVHGHRQGPGNLQGRGLGTALLEAAEADARALGARGMAAWGLALPFWMRAGWFKKHGYRKADSLWPQVLLWKPFCDDARPPRWLRQRRRPETEPGRVTVTACVSGWCPGRNIAFERARRVAGEFGDAVAFRPVDLSEPEAMRDWGLSDALFVDGKELTFGPPPSCEKLRRIMARRVSKLGARRPPPAA